MKPKHCFLLAFLLSALFSPCIAQNRFTNCSAAFLDGKMVVDQYTDEGKCVLSSDASGTLTVCTAILSPDSSMPVDKIRFRIAIRDGNTGTLWSFSKATYRQINIRDILAKCKKGDHIVLLTFDDEFALPHNEILIR